MIIIHIPPSYQSYTANEARVEVEGATVADALVALLGLHPALQPHIQNKRGELRPFVNVLVNGKNIKNLEGLKSSLATGDTVHIIPNIAGG